MSKVKRLLLATGPNSNLFPRQADTEWISQGLQIIRAETSKHFVEIYNNNALDFIFLESNFCQYSLNLIELAKSNPIPNCVWVYSMRGAFSQAQSQAALKKGAHYVLHEPPSVNSLFCRLIQMMKKKEDMESLLHKPLNQRMNEAVKELENQGKFFFAPEELESKTYEQRHPMWTPLVEDKLPNRGASFDGYDAYKSRYSQLFRTLSKDVNNLELVFLTLRSKSVLDETLKNMKVLISSHNNEVFPKGLKISAELAHYSDLFHAVRTNKSVVLNKKQILAEHVQMLGINCIFSIPVRDTANKVTAILIALSPQSALETVKILEHAVDLTSLVGEMTKPLQCLEYFDRVYSSAA